MFKKKKPKPIKTWRTIPQPAFTRSATLLGWWKQVKKGLKWGLYIGLGLLLAGGAMWWMQHQPSLKSALRHSSLAKGNPPTLIVKTDGVLTKAHVQAALALPPDLGLLELDLKTLKQKVCTIPEVKSATLEKDLPDKLCIYITEHNPIARVAVIDQQGTKRVYGISDTGFIFQPSLRAKTFKDLPWLEGITLKLKGNTGFEALPQLAAVAPLLQQAQRTKPKLYAQFKSIQCKGIDVCSRAPWSVVGIKTASWGEWIFATKDYANQLEKLESILEELSKRRSQRVKSIDLSLEGQGVVSFF